MAQDIYCEWNSDFVLNAGGTLTGASGWDRISQRIVRRILTNSAQTFPSGKTTAPDYIYSPNYGIGAGALVDENPTKGYIIELKKRIVAGIISDSSVDTTFTPTIILQKTGNSILVSATLKLLLDADPQTIDIEF